MRVWGLRGFGLLVKGPGVIRGVGFGVPVNIRVKERLLGFRVWGFRGVLGFRV